jgi:hypothetical protein
MPVTAIQTLAAKLKENLNKDGGGVEGRWRLGDHLNWKWGDVPSSREKKRREHAINAKDHRVLADVRFSIRVPSAYSLKTLAPFLGYTGVVQRQEFEDIFGPADDACPVWTERGGPQSSECGHIDAWNKSLELERDPVLLSYAAADITMLRVVYDHFTSQPGFPALAHDMALVSWASAIRMIGVHIDEQARDLAKIAYQAKRAEGVHHCARFGLKNINSSDQVIDFLNDNVVKEANRALPSEDEIDDVEDSRRKDTLEPLLKQLKIDKKKLAAANAGSASLDVAIQNLEMLIQARVFDRKLQFIPPREP